MDRLKQFAAKIVEFWNKYTTKQKTLIISVVAAVILTLVALFFVLNRVDYVTLSSFEPSNTTLAPFFKYFFELFCGKIMFGKCFCYNESPYFFQVGKTGKPLIISQNRPIFLKKRCCANIFFIVQLF